jgi:hypothetical protein
MLKSFFSRFSTKPAVTQPVNAELNQPAVVVLVEVSQLDKVVGGAYYSSGVKTTFALRRGSYSPNGTW